MSTGKPLHTELVAEICRYIEQSESAPCLAELAQRAGLSSYHFHRIFKSITGLTPKAYSNAIKARRLRRELLEGESVTRAIFDAGYQSSNSFYSRSTQLLGMSPSRYRRGGQGSEIRFAVGQCRLGAILVAQSERGICAISLGDDPEQLLNELQRCFSNAILIGGDQTFEQIIARVIAFVELPQTGLDLPLDISGTSFQQRVWEALRKIPPGETTSYTDIAELIGSPRAVRAVASACAANKLAVAIPCHRVIRQDGGLSGYRWGIERKRILLDLEQQDSK